MAGMNLGWSSDSLYSHSFVVLIPLPYEAA